MRVESLREAGSSLRELPALFLCCALLLLAPSAAHGAVASQPDVEDEVMCVTCNVPLNIAESPQADRQKAIIRREIAKGRTKEQIKAVLVDEYGDDVLGLPDEDGFGITAYLIPALLVALLIGAVAFVVPRWRRHGRSAASDTAPVSSLSPADAHRLDEDLARYDV